MPSPFWAILKEWQTFFFIIAGAAASLIGLMFVVISLASDRVLATASQETRIYVTPTLIYFTSALVIGASMTVPSFSQTLIGLLTVVFGLGGAVYCAYVLINTKRASRADWGVSDWVFHVSTPILSYIILTAVGFLLLTGTMDGIGTLPVAMILLLVSGIRNSWDLALWLASHR